jgi:alpha-mannosidase
MSLSKEWHSRISHWEKTLWQICYEPLDTLELSGFTTYQHLTVEQAQKHEFHPMPMGTIWGEKWEYGWFRTEITLPNSARGRRIVLCMNPAARPLDDGECLVWANGSIIGSFGWARKEITLTRNGIPGERFVILAEAYAGHGPLIVGGGPVRVGQESVPDVRKQQVSVGESSFGIWWEAAYQLALDYSLLFELRNRLDQQSLRVSEIDQGLKDVTFIFDLELPVVDMLENVDQARERLRPLLECVNGTSTPTLYAFGHAHIDVAWLWPMAETERKIARTIINQLSLFNEYPDYRYLQSQPQLYIMLKNHYPELYERFKQALMEGKIIPDAAMWVEADTNITGGESLIRQIMYAKKFLQEEFSKDTEVMWLPDVFGFTGSLPQILIGCGCEFFATQKITWAYHGGDPFPYNTFLWEGIDGSTIPAHIFTDYGSHTRPGSLLDRWESRLQKDGISSMLLSFGFGDGGGGPTRDHLEFLSRAKDLEGLPRVRIASPAQFFSDLQQEGFPHEKYTGELYFQAHRGTYTSQAKTKKDNRRCEFSLREAEFWGSIAHAICGFDFSSTTLKDSWHKLLVNQFHDILPGTSIHRVYDETSQTFTQVIDHATSSAHAAAASLVKNSDSFTIFNSLSWKRRVLLDLPQETKFVTVPACGWTTVKNSRRMTRRYSNNSDLVSATPTSLENNRLSAVFNQRGELTSLIDKETGFEMLAGPGNRFCLFKDVPSWFDAWDIDSMTEDSIVPTDEPVQIEVINSSSLKASIRLSRQINNSTLSQIISLESNSRRINFETHINWQESHMLLKVAFPVNIHSDEATHEIQFGHLKRPTHRSRPYDADRFEVCNHKWTFLAEENRGVAVLNDCKYGVNVLGNSINLTLLKSSLAPDPSADKGNHTFTYALFYWNGSFGDCDVVKEAYELNTPILVIPGEAKEKSIFNVDKNNIILETTKPAEDGSGDIILRFYEAKRTLTRCIVATSLPVKRVSQTDMLERYLADIPIRRGKFVLEFRPFEIKTLRLTLKNNRMEII